MYKAKQFRLRPQEDVLADLDWARANYSYVKKIFLCDGDALCLANDKLMTVLSRIKELFPECEQVSTYGSTRDVLMKTPAELEQLRDAGIGMVYLGAESGSDQVLEMIDKGVTNAQNIEAVQKIEESGIKSSVTFISGLGGREMWEEHAVMTGKAISAMQPTYVGLLTLLLEPGAPMRDDVMSGKFRLLQPEEVVAETLLLLKNTNVTKKCVFRSNHASNYLSLRGDLPDDREEMMEKLRTALSDSGMLKDERFRLL
jgi:Fe-S oxidoreductase